MQQLSSDELEEALQAVGELLQRESASERIVVVGGASLSLLGLVPRATRDVDVIARVDTALSNEDSEIRLIRPDPLPEPLAKAIEIVARDFRLPSNWMNTEVALQWQRGLPPSLKGDISWRQYGALGVGLAGRRSMIALKLFAAVDGGPGGVHYQDLLALVPADAELDEAAEWVVTQDASPDFKRMVGQVVERVRQER